MGSDSNRWCKVESRKVIWIVALILGSVVIIQYFQLPYGYAGDGVLPSGKPYFNSSAAAENKSEERNADISDTDEDDTIVRTVSFTPENTSPHISPSSAVIAPIEAKHGLDYISPSSTTVVKNAIVAPSPTYMSVGAPRPSYGNEKKPNFNSMAPSQQHNIPNHPAVPSIADMNDMLLDSRASSFSKSPLWPSPADQELLDARFQTENADIVTNHPTLHSSILRNLTTFVRSYEIMEQRLKVYVYKDGNRPVFHNPRLRGIYASEGWFMKQLEASMQFVTSNPTEAHLFYLPFSSQLLVDYVYVKDSHSFDDINAFLKNYVDMIKIRHPFWNRTDGADHFLVACHDWAPYETKRLMGNCIRALCNSDIKEGFKFGKDVSLPETNVQNPENPMRVSGGSEPSKRTILAFFAGQMHGEVRAVLVKHWENKDPDMQISGPIRKHYAWHMQNSKYCICAKGYEVNSPRVVEAILYGCVPVIVSDNFVPPFFEVLNWESFAVFVFERDIPNLKNILVSISERRYVVMQQRVEQVRQHFMWHTQPQRFDIFHMILHSIWYNRVFRMSPN